MKRLSLCRLSLASLIGMALGLAVPTSGLATEGMAVFSNPSRVVSVGGSITEIVYALGEEKRLIARDSTSVFPEAAFTLPDVGYMRALSPEGVLSVKPSAILALSGSGPREAVDVLKKASVEYIEVPDQFDHQGIVGKISVIGKALGAETKASALADKVDKDLAAAEKMTADIGERKRVLFVLSVQDGKILGSGSATAADGIIAMAGGMNAMQGFTGYKLLSDEAIITAQPDLVLMMDRGGHAATQAQLLALPAIQSTPAGAGKRIMLMDGQYLLGFGPRTANAIRDLATALYGDAINQ